ncbi:uncharacterized protein LOC123260086 [Cotesia glomerata]|uniref:Uncharacterized protein n=1 Tax=Cotesia glomerata TaxID=32391 RepID=A0AAV7I493_COTGL|nr:uncharacterized protein LOC123260086 [Cotesia glomerata]KAH0540724.1 hypothetical protein KQX54_019438 [Cotesia glomerata]
MDDFDDVVIEGSDLHKALTDVGFTDFECTYVDRKDFNETEEFPLIVEETSKIDYSFRNFFISLKQPKKNSYGVQELKIILKLQPLLDDHTLSIQNILKDKSPSRLRYSLWSSIILSSAIASTLVYQKLRTPVIVTCSVISSSLIYRHYCKKSRLDILENLVSIQNNIYLQYKKILKILKNNFCIKLTSNKSQKKFSDLEAPRIKYLLPMCETFTNSIEVISHSYYKISLSIIKLLSKSSDTKNLFSNFDENTFNINGEITYERLKQFYYIYILVQSDMMNLLALLHQNDFKNHQYLANKVTKFLLKLLRPYSDKLNKIIEEYKGNTKQVYRQLKKSNVTKWQDLNINVDLLSRKIQSAYNNISSIVDDLDDCADCEETDEFLKSLMEKMNDVYKEIDTARNFAEFNRLLIGKFLNKSVKSKDGDKVSEVAEVERVPVVFDEGPEIIDEVFEEYIKEEYLKPLYQDNDADSLERAKLDKLLAKNFMSELKEVLIDKYKSMSEREAQALLRYRKTLKDFKDVDEDTEDLKKNEETISHNEEDKFMEKINFSLPPPPPPPLPMKGDSLETKRLSRPPIPLPRSVNLSPMNDVRNNIIDNLGSIINVQSEKLINMNLGIKFPAFIDAEETFVGSGENSDQEIIDEDDQN